MAKENEFTLRQWVLVRDNEDGRWALAQFSNMWDDSYVVVGGFVWKYCIPYESNEHLLGTTDDYEPPYEPEDGDFVTYIYPNGNKYVAIYDCKESESIDCFYIDLCLKNKIEGLENKTTYQNRFERGYSELRPSTDSEKQQLLDALNKDGNDWDAEKKKIVDWKWKPTAGGRYYYIAEDSTIKPTVWIGRTTDQACYDFGNCFRTREEARAMAEKLRKLLKGE